MSAQYLLCEDRPQVPPYDAPGMSQGLLKALAAFLFPLLQALDERMDKRLVRTLFGCVAVIIRFRDRVNGLLLSELGGYLLSRDHAPAGTKRLESLLHSPKWKAQLIKDWLLEQADARLATWQAAGQEALAIWDESPWEKTGKPKQRRALCRSFQQRQAAHPHQAGPLQPATRSHHGAWLALARHLAGRPHEQPRPHPTGVDAVVE